MKKQSRPSDSLLLGLLVGRGLGGLGQLLLLLGELLDLGSLLVLAVLNLGVELLLLVGHHDLGQLLGFLGLNLGSCTLLAGRSCCRCGCGGLSSLSSLGGLSLLLVLLGLEFCECNTLGLGLQLNLVKILVLLKSRVMNKIENVSLKRNDVNA